MIVADILPPSRYKYAMQQREKLSNLVTGARTHGPLPFMKTVEDAMALCQKEIAA